MTTIALETSTRPASLAVRSEGASATATLAADRAHASDLLPSLETLLAEVGATPRSITGVIVGTGPGSFTGLRVGIATALGLARGTGAALFGIPSVESLAYAALEPGEEGTVLLDARSKQLYFARYRRTSGEVEAIVAPRITTVAELPLLLPSTGPIIGEPGTLDAAELASEAALRLRVDVAPRADVLLELGSSRLAARGSMRAKDVEPLYLRPYLVRERKR